MNLLLAALGVEQRTLENPSTPISAPSDAVWEALAGGGLSAAGVAVDREKALSIAPWHRGVTLKSGDVAKVGCYVRRRTTTGLVLAMDHPAFHLVRYKANAEMTAFTWHRTMEAWKIQVGNGYSYVSRNGAGEPVELIPLDPVKTTPIRENGKLKYLYEPSTIGVPPVKFAAADVIHFKGYGWDGLVGYSCIQKARDTLGLAIASKTHASKFFANGARLGVLLEHPAQVSPEARERLLASWKIAREGVDQAWKTVILEEGLKASSPLTMNATDAQLLESRKWDVVEIANFIGVPPHKLGDVASRAFSSIEQEEQNYLSSSLDTEFVGNEQELRDKLLTEEEKRSDSIVVEYDRNALVRADIVSRSTANKNALAGMPHRTINEVRASDGLNGLGPEYDALKIPINLVDAAQPGSGADPAPTGPPASKEKAPETYAAAHARVVADARGQAIRRLMAHARRAAKDSKKFGAWLEGVRREDGPAVERIFAPAAACLAASDGRSEAFHLSALVGSVFVDVAAACDRAQSAKASEFEAAVESEASRLEDSR